MVSLVKLIHASEGIIADQTRSCPEDWLNCYTSDFGYSLFDTWDFESWEHWYSDLATIDLKFGCNSFCLQFLMFLCLRMMMLLQYLQYLHIYCSDQKYSHCIDFNWGLEFIVLCYESKRDSLFFVNLMNLFLTLLTHQIPILAVLLAVQWLVD